jgi:ATP-dependent Lon protease
MSALDREVLERKELISQIPEQLPILTLKDTVVFPTTASPIGVGKERSLKLVNDALVGDRLIGLVAQKKDVTEWSSPEDSFPIGTVAKIQQFLKTPDGTIQLLVVGIERIRIEEKIRIAQRYLIPKEIKAHSLTQEEIVFEEDALRKIINEYTREAGVRNLEREIANVCRKIAREVAEGKGKSYAIKAADIQEYLGKPRFFAEVAERIDRAGIATGLAWTPTGGDILFVEATKMPGKKELTLTGHLGDVMQESAKAALSCIRSKAEELGIEKEFFEKSDIHIHVPAGAISKDGPSAGITIAVAIASLFTERPVKHDVAMTGEITLRGKVLPIGGVKEKVLAALRAGITTVILPERNRIDIEEISELKDRINFVFVENIDQALEAALLQPAEASRE